MFLGSIADSVTGHVASLISQEIGLACGVKGELVKLQSTVSAIGALLHEADRRQVLSQDVKDWIGKLKDVIYDADDLLDDFSSEALLRRRVMGRGERVLHEVRTFFSSSNQILYASKMAHRVKDIRERIDAITDDRVRFQLGGNTSAALGSLVENRVRPETIPFESKPYVIGRDKDKKEVIEFLLNPHFEGDVSILPIVGLGGMGKTTFARLIFNDESVKGYFKLKLWVCVSTNFIVEDILRKIVQECTQNKQPVQLDLNELRKKLGEEVDGKRFLLVLDDVWNENRDKWLELEGFLRNGAKGSKILVTTRSERVATTMAATHHRLSGLPEDESLTLLMRMARKQGHEWRGTALEVIAKEIVRKCVHVPLAITTIGRRLLFTRNREEDWLRVKNIDLSRIDEDESDIMPTLKLSYDVLPFHLKRCFAYCSVFPEDYDLCPSELICLWMAHGFIKSTGDVRTLEEIGQDYFMELASRSFFQELEEDVTGNVRTCKMHDLMHDLARSVAGDECAAISYSRVRGFPEGARHVSVDDIEDNESLKGFEMNRKIRSLLFTPGTIVISLPDISCVRNLRALRLGGTQIEVLPSTIGKLKHLRSLDLSWNLQLTSLPNSISRLCNLETLDLSWNYQLRSLPNSISRLCNLETLNLFACFALEKLPRGTTKLVNLRHLNLDGCDDLAYMPRGIGRLTNLQTLGMFVVGERGNSRAAGLNELSRLTGLREGLRISHLERLGNILNEADASFSLENCGPQSLELMWDQTEQYRANDEGVSERCRPNSDLKGLGVTGYSGARLPSWISQLHKLVYISISSCGQCEYIPPLDQLPSLKRIKLSLMEILQWIELSEDGMSQLSFFPRLEKLSIHGLNKFKGWKWRGDVNRNEEENIHDEGSLSMFPVFSSKVNLNIEDCPRFSHIHGEQLHLKVSAMNNLQQLQENAHHATHPFVGDPQSPTAVPNPSGMVTFISKSSISLYALTSLSIHDIQDAENLPAELFQPLTSLPSLEISNCPRLKSLPVGAILRHLTDLEKLTISQCKELDLSIEEDYGDDVNHDRMRDLQLHGHDKLSKLTIQGIDKMGCLPRWIQYLPNLEVLRISSCGGLKSLPGRMILQLATRKLVLSNCPELGESEDEEGIPDLEFCRSPRLRDLRFFRIEKMTTLPWWIQHLTGLEYLAMDDCENLKRLPEWFPQLTSLKSLSIVECGKELWERCKRNTGEDWPKISHIGDLTIRDA